jgi:hypothetical protein
MAKESVLKSVGRFAANEMLGIDDVKRAVSKAKKGDIKGAVKSAATAALEAGSTVAGAGIGAKVGKAVGKKIVESDAKKAAVYAEKRVLESTPAGRLGSKGGEQVTKRVSEKSPVEVTRTTSKTKTTTHNPKDVTYAKRERSFEERLGDAKKQDTKRENKGIEQRANTYDASKNTSSTPKITKAVGGAAGVVAVASTKKTEASTQSGNVRHRNYTKTVK